ncbi:MAG: hypothetical protein ACO2ZL_07420 [Flavobacteriales bacterium]
MSINSSHLLVAAAFVILGFLLGRITAPHPQHPLGAEHVEIIKHLGGDIPSGIEGHGDVQVIVKSIEDSDFSGDTVFAIPGGKVHMIKAGGEVEVEVELDEAGTTWTERNEAGAVINKRIIVTSEN